MAKSINLDDIKSNNLPYCCRCGMPISKHNDSGWEGFVGDGTITQPICNPCWVDGRNAPGIKAVEPQDIQ